MVISCGGFWAGAGNGPRGPARIHVSRGVISRIEMLEKSREDTFIIPAFVDAHCHFTWNGLRNIFPDLGKVRSSGELLEVVAESAKFGDAGYVIRGYGFDETGWKEPVLPSPEELDEVSRGRPVLLYRVCGHKALVNSGLMAMLPAGAPGLDRSTGTISEGIVFGLDELVPYERGILETACGNATDAAWKAGVTAVCTFESLSAAEVVSGWREGIKTTVCLYGEEVRKHPGNGMIEEVSGLKFFLDGSIGAETAAMRTPYADGGIREPLMSREDVAEALEFSRKLGLTPVFHGIGGRALHLLAQVCRGHDGPDFVRVEHAEEFKAIRTDAWDTSVHRFVMQPNFVNNWQLEGGMYERKLGRDAASFLNPFRTVSDGGLSLAFGSDCMPFGPLQGLPGATGHPDPGERLSVDEALDAYTLRAADVCGFTGLSRELSEGRVADFVILSGSPFEKPWSDLEVLVTVSDGKVVYAADSFSEGAYG